MSQRSTAQHCHIDTLFCTIRKSHVTWNFAVPGPHSEEIRRCILLFLCTLDTSNYVTYIKYINRAIMICLCAQRLVNTDHKTHNKIATNSIDFGLKMHYFQKFSGRCPGPRWGAHSAPQTPSWIFHPQTPLNPDPSTLRLLLLMTVPQSAHLCDATEHLQLCTDLMSLFRSCNSTFFHSFLPFCLAALYLFFAFFFKFCTFDDSSHADKDSTTGSSFLWCHRVPATMHNPDEFLSEL